MPVMDSNTMNRKRKIIVEAGVKKIMNTKEKLESVYYQTPFPAPDMQI